MLFALSTNGHEELNHTRNFLNLSKTAVHILGLLRIGLSNICTDFGNSLELAYTSNLHFWFHCLSLLRIIRVKQQCTTKHILVATFGSTNH